MKKNIQKKKLLIIGAGGHAKVCYDICISNKYKFIGYLINNYKKNFNKIKENKKKFIIDDLTNINKYINRNTYFFIAIGDNKIRERIFRKYYKTIKFANLIHPSSILSKSVILGKNIIVNAGSILNSDVVVSDNTIINSGSIIEHDVKIGKHSHLCPGVKIAGNVKIGSNVFVGLGSNIINNLKIENNVTIGAGSLVLKNIKKMSKVAGVPAKKIR